MVEPAAAQRIGPARAGSDAVLGGLPTTLREELINELTKIERHFREGRWEPAELDGGRLCEIVISILEGRVAGTMPVHAKKPKDMVEACRALEHLSHTAWPRSLRIQIPRIVLSVYEIRNSRDVGHMGGEVNSNHMDASLVLAASKWLVAELVRTFHQVDTATATSYVEALIERETPAVWVVGDKKRALKASLSMRNKVLLLLNASAGSVTDRDLFDWVEYSNLSVFRSSLLQGLHDERLIEYDRKAGMVTLSQLGARFVSANLPAWTP